MIYNDSYSFAAERVSGEAPLFTSDNWKALADGLRSVARDAGIAGGAAAAVAARERDPEIKALFNAIARAAAETAVVGIGAAKLAEEQARQAKVAEDLREAAQLEAERQHSERVRNEAERESRFRTELDRAGREHEERVERGDYRDFNDAPTREREERGHDA